MHLTVASWLQLATRPGYQAWLLGNPPKSLPQLLCRTPSLHTSPYRTPLFCTPSMQMAVVLALHIASTCMHIHCILPPAASHSSHHRPLLACHFAHSMSVCTTTLKAHPAPLPHCPPSASPPPSLDASLKRLHARVHRAHVRYRHLPYIGTPATIRLKGGHTIPYHAIPYHNTTRGRYSREAIRHQPSPHCLLPYMVTSRPSLPPSRIVLIGDRDRLTETNRLISREGFGSWRGLG